MSAATKATWAVRTAVEESFHNGQASVFVEMEKLVLGGAEAEDFASALSALRCKLFGPERTALEGKER